MFTFYVCICIINFADLLVGRIFWPALRVLRHCVFLPALGWLVIHHYILSQQRCQPSICLVCFNIYYVSLSVEGAGISWRFGGAGIFCLREERRFGGKLFALAKFWRLISQLLSRTRTFTRAMRRRVFFLSFQPTGKDFRIRQLLKWKINCYNANSGK